MNIRPKNYDEVMRLHKCLRMKYYIRNMDDELLEKMFHFLAQSVENKIRASGGVLTFTDRSGEIVFSKAIPPLNPAYYTAIELSDLLFSVLSPYTSSGGGGGGVSGNNNNNNNNNNNG